jgi:hypothetical protein
LHLSTMRGNNVFHHDESQPNAFLFSGKKGGKDMLFLLRRDTVTMVGDVDDDPFFLQTSYTKLSKEKSNKSM